MVSSDTFHSDLDTFHSDLDTFHSDALSGKWLIPTVSGECPFLIDLIIDY